MKVLVVMNSSKVKLGGGIIQVILNYRNQIIDSEVEYSFAINIDNDEDLKKQLTCHGEKYFYVPDKKENIVKYILELFKVCGNDKYDVIHVHGNSATMLIELIIARICGIKSRIAHCHNSKCDHPMLNGLLQPIFSRSYTKAVACSEIAGNWIFGENKFEVLNNAIDLESFSYSEQKRTDIRTELNISERTIVIGHAGNFNEQKNQEFLVEIFNFFQKSQEAVLLLLGSGNTENSIKKLVMDLSIQEKVYFMGMRTDVYNWMSAMDIFVFPSKWEGLGMVAIEAQACGLPVLASDTVPRIAKVNNMRFLSLSNSVEEWSDLILEMVSEKHERIINTSDFSMYDIRKEKNSLLKLYMD